MTEASFPDFIYGTAWKEERTQSLTELALRKGFRGIDTANQRLHYFEEGVGVALAGSYKAGVLARSDVFLQTKFTSRRGQDHRLPYDPAVSLSLQVSQSLSSSLDHLRTDYVDSFVLHGPFDAYEWTDRDSEVWLAMRREQEAGRARLLGLSNVTLTHLTQMIAGNAGIPTFVQNRCYARTGWDRQVRALCRQHHIGYQGFSLLTANVDILRLPVMEELAASENATSVQIVFAFAREIGIIPLTGTSNEKHMSDDLESRRIHLRPQTVEAIESLAG